MSRGKQRKRRPAEAPSAGPDSPPRARDDEQLLAAPAAQRVGQEGGSGRADAAAMDRLAQEMAQGNRGARDAASGEAAASHTPMGQLAVEARRGRGAGASEAAATPRAEEGDAAYALRVVDASAALAAALPQVEATAAAKEARTETRAAKEDERETRRHREQAPQVVLQGEEGQKRQEAQAAEEEEAHWASDRGRADRAASPATVATRAQVGVSSLAPGQEGDPAAAPTVGVCVLLDGGNERAAERLAHGMEAVPKARLMAGSQLSYESDDDPKIRPPFLEEEEIEDPELGKLIVPKIRTFALDSTASSQLDRYINEEMHPVVATSGSNSLHHMRASMSPCSSVVGSDGAIPHSKSLVMDDIPPATVFQAVPTSSIDVVEVVAEQSWLITKLTVQLLWALRMSKRWIMCALRLVWFVIILLPPIFKEFLYWLWGPNIHKNIIYGLNARNLLDVYVPPKKVSDTSEGTKTTHRYPVVIFISGGAWIIGYKAWGALMGRVLSCFGIVIVMPDYRNFPQGIVPDMVEDATRALQWVFDNIHLFGGDRDNVTLIGQSAGAHISMCALLEQVERREQATQSSGGSRRGSYTHGCGSTMLSDQGVLSRTHSNSSNLSFASVESVESAFTRPPTWELKQIRSFIGISGPYNMEASLATFHRHGFDKGLVERIMAHRLAYYSPSLRLLAKSEQREHSHSLDDFPPVYLFHGTADKTVDWQSSEQLARALESCHIPVKARFFEGKTHTDPIIEDPICGDDFLLTEIIAIMNERSPVDPRTGRTVFELGDLTPEKRYYPSLLTRFARRVNPF